MSIPPCTTRDDGTGSLLLVTGPMFAGKSSALIGAALAFGPAALVLKPAFDVRDGLGAIASRDGGVHQALPIASWPMEAAGVAMLVIDEVQFLVAPHYAGDIVQELLTAVASGTRVVVGGLDTDYLRRPFEPVARLAEHADRHLRLQARCHVCAEPAGWTAKLRETGQRLELGCEPLYEARCDRHWSPPEMISAPACLELSDRR